MTKTECCKDCGVEYVTLQLDDRRMCPLCVVIKDMREQSNSGKFSNKSDFCVESHDSKFSDIIEGILYADPRNRRFFNSNTTECLFCSWVKANPQLDKGYEDEEEKFERSLIELEKMDEVRKLKEVND